MYAGTCNFRSPVLIRADFTGGQTIHCTDAFLPTTVPVSSTGSMYVIKGQVFGGYASGTTYHKMYREFTEIFRYTGSNGSCAGFTRDHVCNGINYATDTTNFGTGRAAICLLNGRPTFISIQRAAIPASATIPTCTQYVYDINVYCMMMNPL
jgi:hypothetical protein